jgi:hypothetical protein
MRRRLLRWQKPPHKLILVEQVAVNQILQQFITVQLANHTSCIIVIGDVSGVFCKQITHDLIDGVVALFIQSIEYATQNCAHILLIIAGYGKLNGTTFRHGHDLLPFGEAIISQFYEGVKALKS